MALGRALPGAARTAVRAGPTHTGGRSADRYDARQGPSHARRRVVQHADRRPVARGRAREG
eukprot:4757196-Prymnesium_polylepis.1